MEDNYNSLQLKLDKKDIQAIDSITKVKRFLKVPLLAPSSWYHLAVTFNSTEPETVIYYVNGTEVFRKSGYTGSGNMDVGTGDIIIGMRYDLANGFDGSIDGVKLWQRTLSEDEINYISLHKYVVYKKQ